MKKKKEVQKGSPVGGNKDQKNEAIRLAMEQITKAYGTGSIMKMGERRADMSIEVISTGCMPVDIALGIGGLPRGRITEIFGPEASGKTTLCLMSLPKLKNLVVMLLLSTSNMHSNQFGLLLLVSMSIIF